MRRSTRRSLGRLAWATSVLALALAEGPASAQQIKGRVMVLVDTSGSMLWHFNNNNGCGGDGDANSRYTDRNTANKNYYPGTLINGVPDGKNSRLYAAKAAMTNVLNSNGNIDFGLMRYAPAAVGNGCQNATHCCNFATPGCIRNGGYIDFGGLVNWNGDCGPISNGIATDGGQILVPPASNSSIQVLPWADGIENFQDNGQGNPINPELRATGPTPLAGSARTALNKWYQPIYNVSKQGLGSYNPNSPLFDSQIDCRPYVYVMMTDGADTCDNQPGTAPPAAVKALYDVNAANHVLTYVIGLAFQQGDPAVTTLNNMAAEGHTGSARFADNQGAIEAALADIAASSVKVEVCNNKDDNCNNVVDEGFDKGANCSIGVGACARTGIKKCDPNNNTQTVCCMNDNMPNGACVALVAGAPGKEICNGIDDDCNGIIDDPPVCQGQQCVPETCNGKDDDCDGKIDNNLIDVGKVCGINLGQCKAGTTVCQNGKGQDISMNGVVPDVMDRLVCGGGVAPSAEICDGLDNDCDGIVDGINRACYSGPMGTDGKGICHAGSQKCTAVANSGKEMWGPCVGEVTPQNEICNGLDDNCNGLIDDPPGFGNPCCPSGKCGTGVCAAGKMQCSGGALACVGGQGPTVELCNGLDDDCNGKVDDLGNIGAACLAANGCPGTLQCDVPNKTQICQPTSPNCNPGDCGNDPRLGTACGNVPMGLMLPCKQGTWQCVKGAVVCVGAVEPSTEVCNCNDDDCDGQVDEDAFCPGGTACIARACACLGKCGSGEFPCDGGYVCVQDPCTKDADCPGNWGAICDKGECVKGYCAPTERCNPPCVDPLVCMFDHCVDLCANKVCPAGSICVKGNCEDQTCRRNPGLCKSCENGAGGERCDLMKNPPECVPDLCCGVSCAPNKICDRASGMCKPTCRDVTCKQGEVCLDGQCVSACTMGCPVGQWCNPRSGACTPYEGLECSSVHCDAPLLCCKGACNLDACNDVPCGPGFRCKTQPDCTAVCTPIPYDRQDNLVGAGGGGLALGCSVAPGARTAGGAFAWLIVPLLLLPSLVRRCRRRSASPDSPRLEVL